VHRNFRISGDAAVLRDLARRLEPLAEIITLTFHEASALKPRGAVLSIQALNRSADAVLAAAGKAAAQGKVVVEIGSATSLIDTARQEIIDHDADEMLWEEMEQSLRNQGRLSSNSLALMALGGAMAAAAAVAPPVMQIAGFIVASIVAPGFDPIAGISLGSVLGRWHVVRRAVLAVLAGYAVLIAAAALTFALLRAGDGALTLQNAANANTLLLAPATAVIAATSAAAGAIMIVSLRDIYVIGPLIGLVLIPAAAIAACAAIAGDWPLVVRALERAAIDAALVLAASAVVFWVKQRTVHHRRPLD
jgi:hypothetical protein